MDKFMGGHHLLHVATEGLDTSKKVYAAIRYTATFHNEVEELVDVEEVSEESKNKRKSLRLEEAGGAETQDGQSS